MLPEKVSAEEALSFILHNDISRSMYYAFKELLIKHKVKVLPNWMQIQQEKKKCMPENIKLSYFIHEHFGHCICILL